MSFAQHPDVGRAISPFVRIRNFQGDHVHAGPKKSLLSNMATAHYYRNIVGKRGKTVRAEAAFYFHWEPR